MIVPRRKTFVRFEQADGGQVCAYFADGTTASGDVLIGADGSNSVIRKLIVPDAKLVDTGWVIYGKTPLTPETAQWIPDGWVHGFSRMVGSNDAGMGTGPFRKREPFAEAAAKYAPAIHLTETQDYLMWTVSAPMTQPLFSEEQLQRADGATLQAMARDIAQEWHPILRRLIDEADVLATLLIRSHYAEPVKPWQTKNMTLLGDAIHTMAPARGEGANTALRDAELLHHTLVDVVTKGVPLPKQRPSTKQRCWHMALKQWQIPFRNLFSAFTNLGSAPASGKSYLTNQGMDSIAGNIFQSIKLVLVHHCDETLL